MALFKSEALNNNKNISFSQIENKLKSQFPSYETYYKENVSMGNGMVATKMLIIKKSASVGVGIVIEGSSVHVTQVVPSTLMAVLFASGGVIPYLLTKSNRNSFYEDALRFVKEQLN